MYLGLSPVLSLPLLGICQHIPFDPREATIASVHHALFTQQTTCREVVSSFIARIEQFNPLINAIVTLNPEAFDIADYLDDRLQRGNTTGTLFCIPILLKDNFDATPMPTTGGCLALNASTPTKDGPVITTLRRAGAVILGKTNMHELALEGLSVSSLGGQTINPYDFSRTPGGSSGGTGAAIAASFAVLGTGTDTVNSLRSPASANSLFSFRPTRGLVSRAGVVPVSSTQDTVGAIGRSLPDMATALTVMASIGYDANDDATAEIPASSVGVDYAAFLDPSTMTSLKGVRIGILQNFINTTASNETTPVTSAMAHIESLLLSSGATVINITDPKIFNISNLLTNYDVQQFEYRDLLTSYLSSPHLTGPRPLSMQSLYLNTSSFLVIPAQYPFIQSALYTPTQNNTYHHHKSLIANLTNTLHNYFSRHTLDAMIYPQQSTLVMPIGSPRQSNRNGILAALTGSPVITIPIGFSDASETAPLGIPIGMEILGMPWTEGKLLRLAKGIDGVVHARRGPVGRGMEENVEPKEYSVVPGVRPKRDVDEEVYPLGVIGR